jgi:hypothetical protein
MPSIEIPHALRAAQTMWGLKPAPIGLTDIWVMFRPDGRPHSVAVEGRLTPSSVRLSLVRWSSITGLSARLVLPSSVYVATEDHTLYASWPVQTGMGYKLVEDAADGVAVEVPLVEFKVVARRQAASGVS